MKNKINVTRLSNASLAAGLRVIANTKLYNQDQDRQVIIESAHRLNDTHVLESDAAGIVLSMLLIACIAVFSII